MGIRSEAKKKKERLSEKHQKPSVPVFQFREGLPRFHGRESKSASN